MSFRWPRITPVPGGGGGDPPDPELPIVTVTATDPTASETGPATGAFTVSRTGVTTDALVVSVSVGGTAAAADYTLSPTVGSTVTIQAGQASRVITVTPIDDEDVEGSQTVILDILSSANYTRGTSSATVTIADDDAATPATGHPRLWMTTTERTALRTALTANTDGIQDRWQAAWNDYVATGGYYANNSNDTLNMSFLAIMACVRTPSDDYGITWNDAAGNPVSHGDMVSRVTTAMTGWTYNQADKRTGIAIATAYDCLSEYLDASQIAFCQGKIADMKVSGYKWQGAPNSGHWNDQTSTEHASLTCLYVAAEDFNEAANKNKVLQEAHDWAAAHEFMQNGEGLGYAWKNAYAANLGPPVMESIVQRVYGLSDGDSVERCLRSLRDAYTQARIMTQPHAGYTSYGKWLQVRMNFQAPDIVYYKGAMSGAFMLWAMYLLQGRANVDPGPEFSHTPLANSEADLFAWWKHCSDLSDASTDRKDLRACTNYKWVQSGSPANDKGHIQTFWAITPWLLKNVQLPATTKNSADAGIARVWRWWPGSLNWVTIVGGTREDGDDQSLIVYAHRRYWNNNYTAGTYIAGMWQVFRGGPIFTKRGAASHGPYSKMPMGANGAVTLVDNDNYTEFIRDPGIDMDIHVGGGMRSGNSQAHYANVLADPVNDYGDFLGWYSDDQVVAITDDLTRVYNGSQVSTDGDPKIDSFVREWVCIQRGGDGTNRERIFVYDRVEMLGAGRYEARANINPVLNPTINGTETAFEPHYPEPAGVSEAEPHNATWKTTGPVRWNYANADQIAYDNSNLPAPPFGGVSGGGTGKGVLTWIEPAAGDGEVQKRGGLNQFWDPTVQNAQRNNCPHFGQHGELFGIDGEWYSSNTAQWHPQVGLYNVQVWPSTFSASTRFRYAVDIMPTGQAADTAADLTCDAGSKATRCGASAVCHKDATGTRTSGSVTLPAGIALLVLTNLAPSATRTLTPSGGVGITTAERDASDSGVLVVGINGSAGTIAFS